MMLTVLLRRMGSRKSCTAWSSHLMPMLVSPSQSTARLQRSLLVAWQCKSCACGHVEGHRLSCDEPVRHLSLPLRAVLPWMVEREIFFCFALYILIALNIIFTSLPLIANILSFVPFLVCFLVWRNHFVCIKGEELTAVCFVSKIFYEIKKTPTTLPLKHYLFFNPDLLTHWISMIPVMGASGPPK